MREQLLAEDLAAELVAAFHVLVAQRRHQEAVDRDDLTTAGRTGQGVDHRVVDRRCREPAADEGVERGVGARVGLDVLQVGDRDADDLGSLA